MKPRRARVVRRPPARLSFGLAGLRSHRHLILHFGWRYVQKAYLDTWLGWLWIPLRPVIDMFARAFIFGGLFAFSSGDRPYLIFLIVGSAAWHLFQHTALWSYRSIQYNQRSMRRVQLPRLTAVAGGAVAGVVDSLLYAAIGFLVACYFKVTRGSFFVTVGADTPEVLLGALLLVLCAWTVGVWAAPVVARVRDVRLLLPYLLAFAYFLTPVTYSTSGIPERYRAVAQYNPLSAPVELIKNAFLGTGNPRSGAILVTVGFVVLLLPAGLLFFAMAERRAYERV